MQNVENKIENRKSKILIVDDEDVTRILIPAFLKERNYDLTSVASGEEALALLEKEDNRFDVILLDIMMPGMDGFTVLRKLKGNPHTAQIKVIMLTALNPVEKKVQALSAGAADYIVKPFRRDELIARIEIQLKLKQTEDKLRENEQRYRALFERTNDAVFILSLQGLHLKINQQAGEMLGYAVGELVGQPHLALVAPSEHQTARRMLDSLLAGQGVPIYECTYLTKSGLPLPVEVNAALVYDSEGRPAHIQSVVRDISERKRAEKNVKSMAQLATESPNLIFRVTTCGQILYSNMIGIDFLKSLKLLEGEAATGIPDDWQPIVSQVFQANESIEIEYRSGRRVFTCVFVPGVDANHVNIYGTDISERKAAEEALQLAKEELEIRVTERTAELRDANQQLQRELNERKQAEEALRQTQAQLLHSQKMASIGQLAAGIAHEINNPVSFIRSNLHTLQRYEKNLHAFLTEIEYLVQYPEGKDSQNGASLHANWRRLAKGLKVDFILDDMEKLMSESLKGTERVMNIVGNMRTFAHIDEQQWKRVSLNSVLEESLAICWNELKYKAEVIKRLGSPPPVWGLPQQLGQVFMNLLVNAAQAIEDKRTIEIETGLCQKQAQVIIRDTGRGIPPETLGRIFEPFFTTKEVGEGTGLGLSLTYDIIKGHHGKIEVESTLGVGTTFTILLPAMQK